VLRGLVRGTTRRAADSAAGVKLATSASWAQRLAGLPVADQLDALVVLVRTEAAAVLGHASAEAVSSERAFKEAGFDSLAAIELRNRLGAAVGLHLPASLIFDHPAPVALADHLRTCLAPDQPAAPQPVLAHLERLEAAVLAARPDERTRATMAAQLKNLLFRLTEIPASTEDSVPDLVERIESATDDEIFDFIDNEL
jgi:hypothetical protein